MTDPDDDKYLVHHPEEQALLDRVAALKQNGNASWRDVANILTIGSDRTITRASAYKIVIRERLSDEYAPA